LRDAIIDTKLALLMNKPVIISMHRLNFSGGIFEENRKINLELLHDYFNIILKKWPNLEFMSSDELVLEILKDK
jgi:hypothetical protein